MELKEILKNRAVWVAVVLIFSLLLRFYLMQEQGHSFDMKGQQYWGEAALNHGIGQVYNKTGADYPPFYFYVLKINAQIYDSTGNKNFVSKLIPNILEVISGLFLFLFLRKIIRFKYAFISMIFYLFNPALIYDTSHWGQVDIVPTLFIFLSVIFILRKRVALSWIFVTLAVLTKLQAIVIAPIIFIFTIREKNLMQLGKAILFCLLTIIIVTLPFLLNENMSDVNTAYFGSVDRYPFTTANAYNLWQIFNPYIYQKSAHMSPSDTTLLFNLISYKSLGLGMFAIYTLFIMAFLWMKPNRMNALLASVLMCLAFFMLPTQMHERYMYPAFIFLAGLVFISSKFKLVYWVLTTTFLLNLVRVFPYRGGFFFFSLINYIAELPHIPVIVSLVNLMVFIYLSLIFVMYSLKK